MRVNDIAPRNPTNIIGWCARERKEGSQPERLAEWTKKIQQNNSFTISLMMVMVKNLNINIVCHGFVYFEF
jgi:hypothetical protein